MGRYSSFELQAQRKFSRDLRTAVLHTASRGTVGPHRGVIALAKALEVGRPEEVARVNSRIADKMMEATIASYSEIERTGSRPYRVGAGRFSGALGRVIRSDDFAVGDASGIHFVDRDRLDKEAKHWKRLNFGTVGRATPNAVFRLNFDGRVVGQPFGFRDRPRPDFLLPFGYFIHANGRPQTPSGEFKGAGTLNPFFPSNRKQKRYKTVGIRSRHFLDAGLRAMEREFPRQYTDFLTDQLQRGTKSGKAARMELIRVPKNPFL